MIEMEFITQEPPHYAHRSDQLKLIPRSAEAIGLLNENRFLVIVVLRVYHCLAVPEERLGALYYEISHP